MSKRVIDKLSLFSSRRDGPQWIYLWGDLDAYLFARVRKEAFLGCYAISHPGFFPKFNHLLHARRRFELKRLPKHARVSIYHSGDIRMMVNDIRVLHEAGMPGPVRREIDLAPALKLGSNQIYLYCSRIDEPPCLLTDGEVLRTDDQWTVGRDEMHQEPPACYPFVNNGLFPHQERLPETLIEPQRLAAPDRAGEVIFDFGREVFGYPEIGAANRATIMLHPGETMEEARENNPQNWEQHCPPVMIDSKTTGETPVGRMGKMPMPRVAQPPSAVLASETPATRSSQPLAMRYLRVEVGPPAKGKVECRLHAPVYPTSLRGSFECSDERLNRIWRVAAGTLHLGMREFLLDGIKRDRLPWVGDAYVGGLSNAYTFAEWPVLERTLTAAYGESPDLTFPNNLLIWALTWVLALETYRLYAAQSPATLRVAQPLSAVRCSSAGQETRRPAHVVQPPSAGGNFLVRSREKLLAMMAALADHENACGLLVGDAKAWAWVDWADIQTGGAVAAIQMLYVMVLEAAANLGEHWGDADLARLCGKARKLRGVVRATFWDEERAAFVASVPILATNMARTPGQRSSDHATRSDRATQITRHANFLAILAGVATKAQQRAVLSLLDDPNMPAITTPHMKFWEAHARHLAGDTQGMIDTLHRYWGGMLDLGATTFWEDFNPAHKGGEHYVFYGRPFGKSLCHVWATGAVYLLSADILGVRPVAAGFSRFTVTPALGNLKWARGVVPTPAGPVEVEVRGGKVKVKCRRARSEFLVPSGEFVVWSS